MLMLDPASGAIGGIGSGRWVAAAIFSLLLGATGFVAARSAEARSVVECDCEPIELELREEPPDIDDDESAAVDADPATCPCESDDEDAEAAPVVDADDSL